MEFKFTCGIYFFTQAKNYLYILKNMYIIVKNLSKGSKKNTKKTYFI